MKIEGLIGQLNGLLEKMEQGVSIEEGLKLFEEGLEIAKKCYDALNATKGKLETLSVSLNTLN